MSMLIFGLLKTSDEETSFGFEKKIPKKIIAKNNPK